MSIRTPSLSGTAHGSCHSIVLPNLRELVGVGFRASVGGLSFPLGTPDLPCNPHTTLLVPLRRLEPCGLAAQMLMGKLDFCHRLPPFFP